jgi:hypothetical protein
LTFQILYQTIVILEKIFAPHPPKKTSMVEFELALTILNKFTLYIKQTKPLFYHLKSGILVWISNGVLKPNHSNNGIILTIWNPDSSGIWMFTVSTKRSSQIQFLHLLLLLINRGSRRIGSGCRWHRHSRHVVVRECSLCACLGTFTDQDWRSRSAWPACCTNGPVWRRGRVYGISWWIARWTRVWSWT